MKWTIILLAVVLVLILLCRLVLRKRVKDVIPSGSLRFFIGLVVVLAILYFNRYSLLALPLLIHSGYSFGEAMKSAFAMNNDLSFFIGLMQRLCEELSITMPTYLARALENILTGESDFVTTIGDIFEIVLLVW
jgi:hypothetical protein